MIQIPPPVLPSVPATPAAAGAPLTVAIASLPPSLESLTNALQAAATVSDPPHGASVTLTTQLGTITLSLASLPEAVRQNLVRQLDTLFQNQKPLTLTLQAGAPPTVATLNLPPVPAVNAPATGGLPSAVSLPPLTVGQTIPALVLPRDIAVPPPPTAAAQQPNIKEAVTSAAPAAAATSASPSPASQSPPSGQPSLNALLQPGREVTIAVNASVAPNAALPAPAAPNQIAATVIGTGTNGQLLVKASAATLYLRGEAQAPAGTKLLLTIMPQAAAQPVVLPNALPENFPALQQMLAALAQIDPQIAQQTLAMRVPQPAAQLAGPLLFFLSALKQGDVKNWLGGEAPAALTKAGKTAMLTALLNELRGAEQNASDPTVGAWKAYNLPFYAEGQFQPVSLFVHRDGGREAARDEASAKPTQVRFLVDVRMSRLGALQLDGLVKPKKLDMIVRSEKPLPIGLPHELRHDYQNLMEVMGYTGGLSFQTGRQHWITPQKENAARSVLT